MAASFRSYCSMAPVVARKDGLDKLKSIGYVGSPTSRAQRINPDWTHFNSVDYNAELDQVLVSVHDFSEIWILDHSTTTSEAAGHTGGKSGKGGDLLYRWGNPRVYRAGTVADQKLFAQHNAHWIPRGLPGEGHVLIFNNGPRRPDGPYSSVDEIIPPVDEKGRYPLKEGSACGPEKAYWSYSAPKKSDFYSSFISGAHRLPNGNTQICSGANGTVFEVTPDKKIVWKYLNPAKGGFGPGGPGGPGGPPRPGQILPSFLQDRLEIDLGSEERSGGVPEGDRRQVEGDPDRRTAQAARAGLGLSSRSWWTSRPGPRRLQSSAPARPAHGHDHPDQAQADGRAEKTIGRPAESG